MQLPFKIHPNQIAAGIQTAMGIETTWKGGPPKKTEQHFTKHFTEHKQPHTHEEAAAHTRHQGHYWMPWVLGAGSLAEGTCYRQNGMRARY